MIKLEPIIFGVILILIWATLTTKSSKPKNPSNLASLQHSLIAVIEGTSIRTALLTAGLVSVAFGLS